MPKADLITKAQRAQRALKAQLAQLAQLAQPRPNQVKNRAMVRSRGAVFIFGESFATPHSIS